MRHTVRYHPNALRSLSRMQHYILEQSGPSVADAYIQDIMAYCAGFADFPKRGTARPDIGPGIRVVGYRRLASIAIEVRQGTVVILSIFFNGQQLRL